MIFSELITILLALIVSSQTSSLWTSLAIVPISIFLIYSCSSSNSFSSATILLYVLIFVGGLLVLLVSVTAITSSEQSIYFNNSWTSIVVCLSIPLILTNNIIIGEPSNFLFWSESESYIIFLSILFVLGSIIVITKLIISFNGIIRQL